MASEEHQGDESNDENATIPVHFVKVILSNSPRDRLRIPREFVKKYGQDLSNTLFLKLPNGAKWKVNLEKCRGELWIWKGWKEFAECHSLFERRILLFRYERTSCFQVVILDITTGIEIEYPFPRKECRDGKKHQGFQVLKTEVLEESSPCRKRKDTSPLSCGQKCKMRRAYEGNEVDNNPTMRKAALHQTRRECTEGSKRMSTSKFGKPDAVRRFRQAKTTRKGSRASERANTFQSRRPFVKVTMKTSYVSSTYRFNFPLPCTFAERYFDLTKNGEVVFLRDLNGGVWTMKHIIRKTGKSTRYELSCAGWKLFVKDNNLKVDDVCIFELIDIKETTFQVFIYRNTDPPNCPLSRESDERMADSKGQRKKHSREKSAPNLNFQRSFFSDFGASEKNPCFTKKIGLARTLRTPNFFVNTPAMQKEATRQTSRECTEGSKTMSTSKFRKPDAVGKFRQAKTTRKGSRASERANTFRSRRPFVRVTMKPSYVYSTYRLNLSLPREFAKRYFDLNKNGEVVFLRDLNGRVWTMKHIIRKIGTSTRYELSCAGWKAFVKDNNLNEDDVCIFELIDIKETTFQVFIYRNTDSLNCPKSRGSDERQAASKGQRKKHSQDRSTANLNFQRSCFSDFEASENPCFTKTIGLAQTLRIPNLFTKKHIKQGGDVVLQVGGKRWRAKLIYYQDISRSQISAGWTAFLRENDLQVGDTCFFELINKEENVIKISISKHSSAE